MYKCQLCPKTCNVSSQMKDHMAAVHEGKKNYSCESCKMSFGFLSNKKTHQKLGRCPGKLVEKTNNDHKNVDEFMVRKKSWTTFLKLRYPVY